MKNFVKTSLFALLLFTSTAVLAQDAKPEELKTVGSVDLKLYAGKWFEIAKYPNKFQKDCVGNTTANYTLKSDAKIEVLNQCVQKNGTVKIAKGEGKIADKQTNAKLKVRFAPKVLSFLPNVWADYWIIDLDSKYEFVVIGEPKREYLWILSRKPEMSDALYQNILRRIETMGYNPGKLEKTPQDVEIIKGSVIEKQ